MKLLPLCSAITFCLTSLLSAAEPLTTAVLDFATGEKNLEGKGRDAAILVNTTLSNAEGLILVERQEIDKLLSEQELGLSGMVDPATAATVGKILGAKVLVTGRIFQTGKEYILAAKVIGTETGRVFGASEQFGDLDQLAKAAKSIGTQIEALTAKNATTLTAKVETPDERLARWKKLIEGKTLPSLSVEIKEEHISHAIPDPAVQTEFQLLLAQLGFNVINTKESREIPQIEIKGEAFSELAGRRANLVSCRARAEIQVVNKADGKLLLSDRQVEPGVDLAENTAAKTALQNAAIKLMDRVLPALTR